MKNSDATGVSPGDSRFPRPFGRYQLEKLLGKGAMGAVYLAVDSQLGRKVALKIPEFAEDESPELLERFLREARSAAQLNHPNVCPVFDVGRIDGRHYITMAYIEGRPLSDFVGRGKPIPERTAVALIRKIGLGLVHAHAQGIVHRDLKPANVMVDKRREPLIMDFGLAARMDSRAETRMTREGTILGTPAYMSPEQVLGEVRNTGPQSDVFSLGVMLYEMLTGRLPFEGTATEVLAKIAREDADPPSRLRPDLDPHLETICLTMMARSTTERYQSMLQAVQALADWGKEKQPGVRSDSFDYFESLLEEKAPSPPARKPRSTALMSGVASKKNSISSRAETVRLAEAPARSVKSPATAFLTIGAVILSLIAGAVFWASRGGEAELQVVIDEEAVRQGVVVELDGGETIAGFGKSVSLAEGLHRATIEFGETTFETEEFHIAARQEGVFNVSWTADGPTASLDGRPVPFVRTAQAAAATAVAGTNGEEPASTLPSSATRPAARRPQNAPEPPRTLFADPGLSIPTDVPLAVAPFDADAAEKHQTAWAEALKAPVEATNSVGMKLRLIPPGEYLMGTSDEEVKKLSDEWLAAGGDTLNVRLGLVDETPQHRVRIAKPFYFGTHEVTVWQFRQFVESMRYQSDSEQFGGEGIKSETGESTNGWDISWRAPGYPQGDDHPVGLVSWFDAQEFCVWLSAREGRTYRLPTEEEWEYAARAGSHDRWTTGNDAAALNGAANLMDQSYVKAREKVKEIENDRLHAAPWDDRSPFAAPVGQLQPNAFGLFDTVGNLSEWCSDLYVPVAYRSTGMNVSMTPARPQGDRSHRGGNWARGPLGVRSAARYSGSAASRSATIGFRVVCEWNGEPPSPRAVNPTKPFEWVGPPPISSLQQRPVVQSLEFQGADYPKGGLVVSQPAFNVNAPTWPTRLPSTSRRYAVEVVTKLSENRVLWMRRGDTTLYFNAFRGIAELWCPRGSRVFRFSRFDQSNDFRTLTLYVDGRHIWAMVDGREWSGPIMVPDEPAPAEIAYGVSSVEAIVRSFRVWDLSDSVRKPETVAATPTKTTPTKPSANETRPTPATPAAAALAGTPPPLELEALRKLKPVLVEDFDGPRSGNATSYKNGRYVWTTSGAGTTSLPHRVDELHLSREFALEVTGRVDRADAQWGLAFYLGRYLGMVTLDGEGNAYFHDRFGLTNPVPLKFSDAPTKKELHTLTLQVRGRTLYAFVDGRPAEAPIRVAGDVSTSDFWFTSNAVDGGNRRIEIDRLTLWTLPPTPTPASELPRELSLLRDIAPTVDETFDAPTRGVGKPGDYQAGRFLIRDAGVVHRAVALDAKSSHFAFEAVGRAVGRRTDHWGLQLRLADKSHCSFLVERMGGLWFSETTAGEPKEMKVPGFRERPSAHRLTIEVHGNRVTAYLDGVASDTVTLKDAVQPTTVAFVSGKDRTVGSEFESFRAWKLSESPLDSESTRRVPTYFDDFSDPLASVRMPAAPEHRYENGQYVLEYDSGTYGWNVPLSVTENSYIEVRGRTVSSSPESEWAFNLTSGDHGFWVSLNGTGQLDVRPSMFSKRKNEGPDTDPIADETIRAGQEYNTLGAKIEGRQLSVYVNRKLVYGPVPLSRDMIPGTISLSCQAKAAGTRAEFDEISVWSASEAAQFLPVSK